MKIILSAVKFVATIIASLLVLFIIYLAWFWWDVKRLKLLCSDVRIGMAVSALPELVESHGYNRHWVESRSPGKNVQGQTMYVPSTASVGEVVCAIHANEGVVVSAVMEDL